MVIEATLFVHKERQAYYNRLKPSLNLRLVKETVVSDTVCDCGRVLHYKLKLVYDNSEELMCPVLFLIRLTRLGLNGVRVNFDPDEILERCKYEI